MSEERNNATLLLIKDKFNDISKNNLRTEICQLMTAVDTSKVGQIMIENLKFSNYEDVGNLMIENYDINN